MFDAERWTQIRGYEGAYEVSDLGRVRGVTRMRPVRGGGMARVKGRVLKQWHDADGYMMVYLSADDKRRGFKVHRLVALHFIPNNEEAPQVNHLDCNKKNNAASNLEWVTHKKNHEHATAAGRHIRLHKTDSKLSPDQVKQIRADAREGVSAVKLAGKFGVHRKTVEAIKAGRAWRSINEQRN